MDVEKFGDIIMACIRIFLPERCADSCRFLLDESSFVGDGLRAHEIMLSQRTAALKYLAGSDTLDKG